MSGWQLLLNHQYQGIGLRLDYAQATRKNMRALWGRPVHLETGEEGQQVLLSCEGGGSVTREVVQSQAA